MKKYDLIDKAGITIAFQQSLCFKTIKSNVPNSKAAAVLLLTNGWVLVVTVVTRAAVPVASMLCFSRTA